jgi:integrase
MRGQDGLRVLCRAPSHPTAILCSDRATGNYLFANRNGTTIKRFKKGFAAACVRAGIENLRPYDLRGTFATHLAERYVSMDPIISSPPRRARSSEGFGSASRNIQ